MQLSGDPAGSTSITADAIGAFGHDVRSPLNAITMLVDVARRLSPGADLVLDDELTRMLLTSVEDIVRIVGELQEVSRLERGKTTLRTAPASLAFVLDRVVETLEGGECALALYADGPFQDGNWDEERLAMALSELARGVNRGGGATTQVALRVAPATGGAVCLHLACGVESGEERRIDATLGWAYFRAVALLRSMGATTNARRQRGFMEVSVLLPASVPAPVAATSLA